MRYIAIGVIIFFLAACGSEQAPTDQPEAAAQTEEHILSDQQKALEAAKEAAKALEDAAREEAEKIRAATE